jgi:LacI family transcriptional regulator
MAELIDRHRIPAVWLNARRQHNCVLPDNRAAGRGATEHLLELGHRRITYARIDNRPEGAHRREVDHFSLPARQAGYFDAMEAAGLEAQTHQIVTSERGQDALALCREWMAGPQRPGAVVCYSVAEGLTLIAAALASGLNVPEDLSLVAMGPTGAGPGVMDVTRMITPDRPLGRAAVEMLGELIGEPGRPIDPVVLPFEFRQGQTTARPR